MNAFGIHLRAIRKRCIDPDVPGRSLTQERLGELLGRKLDIRGSFSGAAVSDWERGKSKIHADDRLLLTSLLSIFYEQGGIGTVAAANQFLESGNYRSLNSSEIKQVFPGGVDFTVSPSQQKDQSNLVALLLQEVFSMAGEEFQAEWIKAKEGPKPVWPRMLVALTRAVTDRWSAVHILKALPWVWIWLVAWGSISPSLRWPFANQGHAKTGIWLYTGASLVLPLLIGLCTNTRNSEFRQSQSLAGAKVTRLYTYQGAFVGFQLGYFVTFSIVLFRYYLRLPLPFWLELILMAIPVLVASMGARLVPYNLWQAYGRLSLADGGIFFVFVLLGPLWGFFFWKYYPVILAPFTGGLVILLATTLFVTLMAWQYHKTSTT